MGKDVGSYACPVFEVGTSNVNAEAAVGVRGTAVVNTTGLQRDRVARLEFAHYRAGYRYGAASFRNVQDVVARDGVQRQRRTSRRYLVNGVGVRNVGAGSARRVAS